MSEIKEERFIRNEWIRMGKIESIFGIKPIRCRGFIHDYLINRDEMLSVYVVFPKDEPVYAVEYAKIDFWWDDNPIRKETGRKYSYFETFEQLVEYFHKWFRMGDDDEQLVLF